MIHARRWHRDSSEFHGSGQPGIMVVHEAVGAERNTSKHAKRCKGGWKHPRVPVTGRGAVPQHQRESPLTDVGRRATARSCAKKIEAEDSHGWFRTGLAQKRIRLPRLDPRGTWLQGDGTGCSGAALYRSCGGRPMDDRPCSVGGSTKVWRPRTGCKYVGFLGPCGCAI